MPKLLFVRTHVPGLGDQDPLPQLRITAGVRPFLMSCQILQWQEKGLQARTLGFRKGQ